MSTATSPTTEVTCQRGFEMLCEWMKKRGPESQLRVNAHVRAVMGRSMPVPVYHNDASIPEADKLALYKLCVGAVVQGDYSKLQGQSGVGDKAAAAAEPVAEEANKLMHPITPKRRSLVTVPETPAEDISEHMKDNTAESDDPVAAALRVIAASAKPKVDPVVNKRLDEYELNIRAINSTITRLDRQLDELNIPEEEEIKEVVTKCLNNGEFPVSRVQELIDASIKKARPEFDLDKHIKPRIDDLLGGTIKDLIAKGPSTITVKEEEDDEALASSVPDKNDLDVKTYFMSPGWDELLQCIDERSKDKHGENIMLVGPHGCGKTTLAKVFAAKFNKPMLIMDCPNIREPRDWFGHKTAINGSVGWHRSQFDRCLEAGNHVIVLDELPRTTDQVRNALFALLDFRRATYLEERGDYIRVGKGTVFFATANLGFQYTGSSEMDAALTDRFSRRIEVNYLPLSKEAEVLVLRTGIDKTTALKLAEVADILRKKALGNGATLTRTVSARQLVEAAEDFKLLGAAGLTYTISNHFSAEGGENSERHQVLQCLQGKFGKV